MPKRSKASIEKERNDMNSVIENFSPDQQALEPLAKAFLLREQNFSISAICDALGINRSQFLRARASMNRGAPIGVQGRPQYLSVEQEEELKNWCFAENNASRKPTFDALRMKAYELALNAWKMRNPTSDVALGPPEPSSTWYRGFLARHEDLIAAVGAKPERRQRDATTPNVKKRKIPTSLKGLLTSQDALRILEAAKNGADLTQGPLAKKMLAFDVDTDDE